MDDARTEPKPLTPEEQAELQRTIVELRASSAALPELLSELVRGRVELRDARQGCGRGAW